jgi:aryl-alcohol dehydrogenase-like predicted oxidoreductase
MALEKLITQGKVRAVGLSDFGCEEIAAALLAGPVAAVQTAFSLFQRRACEDFLPFCESHRVAGLVHTPLAKGLLTGRFNADSKVRGIRAADSEFLGPRFLRNLERVAGLSAIARQYGKSVAQLSLQWVIRCPGVTSAIVGAKRPSQIEEDAGGDGWNISSEDLIAIEDLLAGA